MRGGDGRIDLVPSSTELCTVIGEYRLSLDALSLWQTSGKRFGRLNICLKIQHVYYRYFLDFMINIKKF